MQCAASLGAGAPIKGRDDLHIVPISIRCGLRTREGSRGPLARRMHPAHPANLSGPRGEDGDRRDPFPTLGWALPRPVPQSTASSTPERKTGYWA